VSFLGKEYPVTAWFEALETVVQELVKRHPRDYEGHLLAMVGRKRPYISRRGSELRKPRRIAGSGLYLESNLSAQAVHPLILNLLEKFGYEPKVFKVTYQ